jgi:uncharacterized protein YchJ
MITYELDSLQDSFLKITFEQGQFAGQRLHFDEFDTCGVATCNCFNLHAMQGDREFIFDVDEQVVEAIAEEDEAYTEAIEAELTEEVWGELFEKFIFLKGIECDLMPISEVVHNFTETQYKEVLGEAVMFYYDDVFPHSMDFKVTVDDVDYLLLDLYCLVPSCDCHEVILQVIDSEYEESLFSVSHDVKQKTFKLDQETEVKASNEKVQAILEAIRNQFTEVKIKGISYADRYKRMRTVFKDFLVRKGIPQHYHPETRLVTTIGRNDLCSCGSGKKYKKCCGK